MAPTATKENTSDIIFLFLKREEKNTINTPMADAKHIGIKGTKKEARK